MELGCYFLFLQEQVKDIIIGGGGGGGGREGRGGRKRCVCVCVCVCVCEREREFALAAQSKHPIFDICVEPEGFCAF